MKRTEPPPLARWMLEHCTPVDSDQAIAGDLLEDFYSGRSDGWYWHQALSACAIAWLNYLRQRILLLTFALLWSMLAPAWKMFSDRIEDSPIFASTGHNLVAPIAGFVVWTVLNSAFLWIGICTYAFSRMGIGRALRAEKIHHAFLLSPLVFLPTYFIVFVLANLYQYSLFAGATIPATLTDQLLDIGMLENTFRIPYIITMVCALWNANPQPAHFSQLLFSESSSEEPSAPIDPHAPASRLNPFSLKRFLGLMVAAGLVNAMIAGFILCRLPKSYAPTFASLLIRAISYVAVGAVSGVVGTWFYWKSPASPFRERSPIPFPLFAIVCAAGWIWVPSLMLFSEQISPITALTAAVGAVLLAVGLRKASFLVFAPVQDSSSTFEPEHAELFAESLYRARPEAQGYVIAICLYAAGWALTDHSIFIAAALCALSAFLFVWKRTSPRDPDLDASHEYKRAAIRLAIMVIPAILVTIWAMLNGVAHRNRMAEMNTVLADDNGTAASERAHQMSSSKSFGPGGYESLILWPLPEKKQFVPPLPPRESLLAPGTTQPLTIPFDGVYWYVQPPDKFPGPTAHQAHGTPLGADIASNNSVSLVMDAHQSLGAAIPIARCREIQVEIENRDNRMGVIAMALLLTDATSPGKPTAYLGQQPIVSTEPTHFSYKSEPMAETLRFFIPTGGKLRRFNEITVMMLPDVEHAFVAPMIAIKQFQLFPR